MLLAGDAAHVHAPSGGQGLNLGLQDAANLGWKLAAVVQGRAPVNLLDTYGAERHPVAARVLHNTRAQTALMNPDPRITPLRELFAELMELDDANRYLTEMVTAVDVAYAVPDAGPHPLAGRFVPPYDLVTAGGTVHVRDLFHDGRWVLADLGAGPRLAAALAPYADRVALVTAAPVPDVDASALLVRPDGYVAWACPRGGDPGTVRAVLARWCVPSPARAQALG